MLLGPLPLATLTRCSAGDDNLGEAVQTSLTGSDVTNDEIISFTLPKR